MSSLVTQPAPDFTDDHGDDAMKPTAEGVAEYLSKHKGAKV